MQPSYIFKSVSRFALLFSLGSCSAVCFPTCPTAQGQGRDIHGTSIPNRPQVRPQDGAHAQSPPDLSGQSIPGNQPSDANHASGGHGGNHGERHGGYPGQGPGYGGVDIHFHHSHGRPPIIYPPIVIDEWGGYPHQGVYYGYGTISYPTYVTPYANYGGYYPPYQYPYAPGVAPGFWTWNQQPFNAGAGLAMAGVNPGFAAGNFAAAQPNAIPPMQAAVPDPLRKPEALSPEQEILRRVSVLKPSNEAGRIRSDDLIADGDREFANQAFRRAAGIYRQAIAKAPDYPAGHLRAGHAYVATADFELALTYFCMGFELARTTTRPGFSLADLYQGDDQAKQQHQAVLADAIQRQPDDGGLLFLLGVTQHYDGHPLEAKELFRKAAQMDGAQKRYAKMFLQ